MQSLRTLMSGLIDYAGLFPPAKLDMSSAAETYARWRVSDHEWVLGRFICPVSRLDELTRFGATLMPGTHATSGYREHAAFGEPWRISAIIDGPLAANLEKIESFNAAHAAEDRGLARVDMIELRVGDPGEIDRAMDEIPGNLYPHFEFPVNDDPRGFVAALAGQGAAAKIRTGGITPEAFPTAEQVAAFLVACDKANVAFKATAGLHHPVRGAYKLTYEPNAAQCTMFGFVNLFVAAVMVRARGADAVAAARILSESDPKKFAFSEQRVSVAGAAVDTITIARVRETFALSFGSCSIDEPVNELAAMLAV